mmetsp:Transcript_10765/g.35665  ORF Transcript_10765/g.35665 Transcript_10765/m.35665 type:complete len:98 (+) Transcript_10765:986-1279(+)
MVSSSGKKRVRGDVYEEARCKFCCWEKVPKERRRWECPYGDCQRDDPSGRAIIEFAEYSDDHEWRYFISTASYASAPPPASLKEIFTTTDTKTAIVH